MSKKPKIRIIETKEEVKEKPTNVVDLRCQHTDIVNGICTVCKVNVEGGDQLVIRKKVDRSIMPDMANMTFTNDIKKCADSIFHKLNQGTRRSDRRKLLIFYCLHCAHLELKICKDPKLIAKEVGIDSGEMSAAFSMFSETQTGYQPKRSNFTPQDILPDFYKKLNESLTSNGSTAFALSQEFLNQCLQIAEEVLDKDPELLEKYPQAVAAGILKYALMVEDIYVKSEQLVEVTSFSEATINANYKQVAAAHNS